MRLFVEIICFTGGLAVFMFGLKLMSENSAIFMGNRARRLIVRCAGNPFYGVLTGAAVSSLCQSGAVANIIAVDFVCRGVLNCVEACSIIIGTNIGTTITAQLASFSGAGINMTVISSAVMAVGLTMTFSNKQKLRLTGNLLMGFGLVFAGLYLMEERVANMSGYAFVRKILCIKNPALLFLNGMAVTAVIQSSSAFTALIISFSGGGLIDFPSAVFLILGANVGSCFSVVIASVNKTAEARLTAYFNVFFNLFGAVIAFAVFLLFGDYLFGLFEKISPSVERQIADFQTIFNLLSALLFAPVLSPSVTAVRKFAEKCGLKEEDRQKTVSKKGKIYKRVDKNKG